MNAHVLRLDVRPLLASGRDPFAEIMRAASGVPINGVMVVVAPFDPAPLREVLAVSGFTSAAVPLGPREWEITFRRAAREVPANVATPVGNGKRGPAQARTWIDDGKVHVDARGLDTGPALYAVLAALDAIDGGATLVAHLDRNIDALYPEFARRGCEAAFVPGERAEVRLEVSTPTDAGRAQSQN